MRLLKPQDQQTDAPAILEPVLPSGLLPKEVEAETAKQQSELSEQEELIGVPSSNTTGSGGEAAEEGQPTPDAAGDVLPGTGENDPQDCRPCGDREGIAERQEETLTDGQSAEVLPKPGR
jgi:hypothetical protein